MSSFKKVEEPGIDERFDYAEMVRRQIERCDLCRGDPELFIQQVIGLESKIIPEDMDDRYIEEYNNIPKTVKTYQYKYACGHRMGTPENPVYRNNPKDWNYNPNENNGKPILVSPILVEIENPEQWNLRQKAAFDLFARLKVVIRRPGATV